MVTPTGSVYTQTWSLQDSSNGESGIWRTTSSPRGSVYQMPARPGFEAPLESKPQPRKGGVLGFAGDVFVGAGEAVADTLVGVANLVLHPLASIAHLASLPVTLVTKPGKVIAAFKEPYATAIKEGRTGKAIGRGLAEVGLIVFGPKLLGKGISPLQGGAIAGQAVAQGVKVAERLDQRARTAAL